MKRLAALLPMNPAPPVIRIFILDMNLWRKLQKYVSLPNWQFRECQTPFRKYAAWAGSEAMLALSILWEGLPAVNKRVLSSSCQRRYSSEVFWLSTKLEVLSLLPH